MASTTNTHETDTMSSAATEKTPLLTSPGDNIPFNPKSESTRRGCTAGISCCGFTVSIVLGLAALCMPVCFFQLGVIVLPVLFDQDMSLNSHLVEEAVIATVTGDVSVAGGIGGIGGAAAAVAKATLEADVLEFAFANEKLINDMIIMAVFFIAVTAACTVIVDEFFARGMMFMSILWCVSVAMSGGMVIASTLLLGQRCVALPDVASNIMMSPDHDRCVLVSYLELCLVGIIMISFVMWTMFNVSRGMAVFDATHDHRGHPSTLHDYDSIERGIDNLVLVLDEPPSYEA